MSARSASDDVDLMLYFDGELDAERMKVVEERLRVDETMRNKLAGMGLVSSVFADAATVSDPGDVTESVFAQIDADVETPASRSVPTKRSATLEPAAANDNGRRIWAFAVVAAAVAAGVLVWGRLDPLGSMHDGGAIAKVSPEPQNEPPSSALITAPTAELAIAPNAATPSGDDVGAHVSAVDFGARAGAVFYLPSDEPEDPRGSGTTVIWVNDDARGGKK